MARKLTYNTTRFDGGMTDNVRILDDTSKCAFSSHFDIYSNPEELRVMPGYVADEGFGGSATGMRDYKIRAFHCPNNNFIWAVGEKATGGGTKVFNKEFLSTFYTDEWLEGSVSSFATHSEANRHVYPRVLGCIYGLTDNVVFIPTSANPNGSGFLNITTINASTGVTEHLTTTTGSFAPQAKVLGTGAQSGTFYINISGGIIADNSTAPAVAINTSLPWTSGVTIQPNILSMVDTVRGLWYVVQRSPETCDLRLWDKTSALNDLTIEMKNTRGAIVGEVGGSVVVAANERLGISTELAAGDPNTNGMVGFSIRTFDGYSFSTPYRQYVPTPTGSLMVPLGQSYKGSMLFYARFATDEGATTFREGIWALGRRDPNRPVALSMLMDMSTLGQYNGYYTAFNHHYFAHGTDWRISRLDRFDTGTYDVPATYETLFYGATTPFLKGLEGITVRSQTLPSGATIEVQYRTEPDGTWTSMGTSTSGKKHNFTRANGVPIGKFQEIQFKIIATGKVVVNGISVGLTESDDLPYNL